MKLAEVATKGAWRVYAGFTTRAGGFSNGPYRAFNLGYYTGDDPAVVTRNRQLLADYLGVTPVFMEQVHGATIRSATQQDAVRTPHGDIAETDGLILDLAESGSAIAAAVMVADCVPLLLVSTAYPRGAVVHVGRKGLLAGIAPKAVRRLGGPEGLEAFIGPSIAGADYEVPAAMRDAAAALIPEAACITRWGTPGIDVPGGLVAQLRRAGVTSIHRDGRSTFQDPAFYSYRRSAQTGRFAGVLALYPAPPGAPTHPVRHAE